MAYNSYSAHLHNKLSRLNINKFIKKCFSLFVNTQIYLCTEFDKIMPERFRVDGHQDFKASFAPKYLRPRLKVYDVGGGKIPYIDHRRKAELGLAVVGLDIDREELRRAPQGATNEMILPQDITRFKGGGDADLIICQAVLRHEERGGGLRGDGEHPQAGREGPPLRAFEECNLRAPQSGDPRGDEAKDLIRDLPGFSTLRRLPRLL